jgi:hypothetical protein
VRFHAGDVDGEGGAMAGATVSVRAPVVEEIWAGLVMAAV